MIYVVSDLHGSNKKFQKLLKEINFADKDIMYVLGDIVDYGEESIELLCDNKPNCKIKSSSKIKRLFA